VQVFIERYQQALTVSSQGRLEVAFCCGIISFTGLITFTEINGE